MVTLWNNERIEKQGAKGDGEILFQIPEIERGVFHDFVYKIVWSADAGGEIRGWMRQCPLPDPDCGLSWQEIVNYSGSTGYESDVVKGYYFKLGLYTVTDFDVAFTAYHKNYRIGANTSDIGVVGKIFQ